MTSRSEEHGEVIPAIRRLSRCGRATAAVDKDLAGADTGERRPCSTWLASASSEVSGMSAPDVVAARLNGQVLAPAGSNLVLAEWVAQASVGDEPLYQAPLHLHEEDEAWYVLEGTLRVWVGDDQVEVPAGGAAIVPGGTAHTFWNPSPEPPRYVLVMGARTYALIQALHASDDRGPDRIRQLFEEHGARLVE